MNRLHSLSRVGVNVILTDFRYKVFVFHLFVKIADVNLNSLFPVLGFRSSNFVMQLQL